MTDPGYVIVKKVHHVDGYNYLYLRINDTTYTSRPVSLLVRDVADATVWMSPDVATIYVTGMALRDVQATGNAAVITNTWVEPFDHAS